MKKRLFLIVICILLAASFVGAACAEEVTAAAVTSGTCGENLTWVLEDGTLTISGTGEMKNYTYSSPAPWADNKGLIREVVVDSGVTTIGEYAFRNFYQMTSVSLPESLTSIGEEAFSYCHQLVSISIPEGVVSIGDWAFSGCDSLKRISLPSTMETIGIRAFAECTALSDVTYNGTKAQANAIAISGSAGYIAVATWHCTDGDMEGVGPTSGSCGENLTWTLADGTLTISGTGAMDDYNSGSMPWGIRRIAIHTVVVNSGVTSIGNYAFTECSNLTGISLPDGLTAIGMHALSDCYSLEEIAIPNSVSTIERYAFAYCIHLKEVTLPKSLTTLEDHAFAYAWELSSVQLPSGLTCIPDQCFSGCALSEVSIPEGVTSVAFCAFSDNEEMTRVSLPSTIKTIDYGAFLTRGIISDVSYAGTKADAEAIIFYDGNSSLCGATWHCTDGDLHGIGPTSGSCGENLTWEIQDGTLTISGTGEMNSFDSNSSPWEMRKQTISSVVVNSGVTTIGDYAFSGFLRLSSVSLPEGLTSIGEWALSGNNNLQSISLPASIETIGYCAFDACSVLENVTYGGTLAQAEAIAIESYNEPLCEAIWYCSDGESQGIGEFAGKKPFSGTCGSNVTWKLSGGTLTISGTGPMYSYSNPDSAPWTPRKSAIRNVVVSSGVTSIGEHAFMICENLTGVSLPDGLIRIGSYAFSYCSLTSVTIPEGVTTIEHGVFLQNTRLQSISLPATIGAVYADAFNECSSLTDVYYNGTLAEAEAIRFDADNAYLIEAAWHCTDGESQGIGVTSGTCGENLTWVLEDGTLTISGTGAMDDYDYSSGAPWNVRKSTIQTLVVSSGVTSIGDYAFYMCGDLSKVSLPDGLTAIGSYAFSSCWELTTITIPEGIVQISAYAFCNDYRMQSISLPSTIQQIDESAFAGCSNLQTVSFAGTRAETQKIVFGGSNAPLTGAVWYCSDGNLEGVGPTSGTCGENLSWVLEDGTLTISGTGAMDDFEWETIPWEMRKGAIHSVVVNSGVTTIGNYAFNQCDALSSVSLPEGLTHIGEGAFWNCYRLTGVSIPDSVTSIADAAFAYCSGIQELQLPASLTSLGSSAFRGIFYVTSLQIPGGVTFIPDNCFVDCGFQEVTLGEGVTRIGASAFAQNTKLQSISLPSTMAFIDSDAFSGCYSLTDVNYAGTQAMADVIIMGSGNNALKAAQWNCTGTDSGETGGQTCGDNLRWTLSDSGILTITGTGAMTDFASGAAPWYASRSGIFYVAIGDGATSIGKNAFQGCANLLCINLPASVTSVGENAFAGCSSLSIVNDSGTIAHQGTMSIGSGNGALTAADWYCSDKQADTAVTGMCAETVYWAMKTDGTIIISGRGAMRDNNWNEAPWSIKADSIRTVVVNSGVTTIGKYAFFNCTNLTGAALPEGLTRIGEVAFCFCSSLTDITIPEGVTSIGQFAFNENTALEYVSLPSTIRTIENGAFNMCANLAEVSCALTEAEADNIVIGENNDPLSAATWTFLDSPEVPLTVLKLPENLTVIGEEAFANVAAGKIVIPATVSSIESRAFADSTRLRVLYFEGSPDTIAYDILSGCRSVKISVVKGSTAEAWATENGYTVEYHE